MRRSGLTPHRLVTGTGPTSFPEANPNIWVQLREEQHNTNTDIFEIVQELKEKMARLRADNKRLMQEQEKNMKSLCDQQNQRQPIPSPEHGNMTREQEFKNEKSETEVGEEN